MQAHYATAPKLDLKNRDREAQNAIQELFPDGRMEHTWFHEPLMQRDLLEDLVCIITGWFSDIWRTIYEIKADFRHAHKCLLWSVRTSLKTVALATPSSPVHDMPISISIESQKGHQIRLFEVNGLLDIRVAALWLWKELFLSMLTVNVQRAQVITPIMLNEIEDNLEWPALLEILTSGDGTPHGDCWTASAQYILFQDILSSHLTESLGVQPSVELYHAAISTCHNAIDMKLKLQSIIRGIEITSRDILLAVLSIYIDTDHPRLIVELLRIHRHFLRVNDFAHLQAAASALARHESFLADALTLVSQGLKRAVTSVNMMVLGTFAHFSDPAQQAILSSVFQLRPGTQTRQCRIRQWVAAACSPGNHVQHPGISAVVTNLPSGPSAGDTTTMDAMDLINPGIGHLVDIAPYLGDCLAGWVTLASAIRGGEQILQATYGRILKEMEFFKAPDVVDAMILHMSTDPTMASICDGLQQLSRFCKARRTAAITKRRGLHKRENMKTESVASRLWQ
ncbi:uncharacterized protein SCHCODRAFT_01170220 [Schizophyllum commune H4-8]|nr:uncharacterized protein SCHCODRAFT_01170220 [Schizophyllum commune H4-8]KAI5895973.1 hypothetical protein SCHCODRAFT_01170220 [Schizophyllum commune H4-8]